MYEEKNKKVKIKNEDLQSIYIEIVSLKTN